MRFCGTSRQALAAALLACAALLPAAPGTALAQSSGVSADAKEHFKVGVDLLKDPDGARYADAYVHFKLAYERSGKSWKVLGNLALCAMKMERDGEAIDDYDLYLSQGGKDIERAEREQIERDLRVLKTSVARVTLKADVPSAQIDDARQKTNGSNLNSYTLEGGAVTLGLHAGRHTLTARAGGKQLEWIVDISPGQPAEHTFVFAEPPVSPPASASAALIPPPPPPAAPPIAAPATERPASPLRTAGFVAAGVGGAMLIGGVVTGVVARSKFNDLKSSCVGDLCPLSRQSDKNSVGSLATVTNVLLIGGGVLAVGGVALALLAPPRTEAPAELPRPSLALSPAGGPGGFGLLARGTF